MLHTIHQYCLLIDRSTLQSQCAFLFLAVPVHTHTPTLRPATASLDQQMQEPLGRQIDRALAQGAGALLLVPDPKFDASWPLSLSLSLFLSLSRFRQMYIQYIEVMHRFRIQKFLGGLYLYSMYMYIRPCNIQRYLSIKYTVFTRS